MVSGVGPTAWLRCYAFVRALHKCRVRADRPAEMLRNLKGRTRAGAHHLGLVEMLRPYRVVGRVGVGSLVGMLRLYKDAPPGPGVFPDEMPRPAFEQVGVVAFVLQCGICPMLLRTSGESLVLLLGTAVGSWLPRTRVTNKFSTSAVCCHMSVKCLGCFAKRRCDGVCPRAVRGFLQPGLVFRVAGSGAVHQARVASKVVCQRFWTDVRTFMLHASGE